MQKSSKCNKVLQILRFGRLKFHSNSLQFHVKSSSESIVATKMGPRGLIVANLRATSSKNRLDSIQEGRLGALAQPLPEIWEALERPRAIPKLPRGPKTPPQRVPKRAQERPKRVPSTIFECLNSFEMRLTRKCKNHQKCCKVLQNSRFGGSESQ